MNNLSKSTTLRPINLGVVGTGFGAGVHIPALGALPGVRISAIGGRTVEKAQRVARQHGIPFAGSIDAVLAHPDVNVVAIALPPAQGAEAAIFALRRGLAVMCEKPLGGNLGQARRVSMLCDGRPMAIDFELAELDCFRLLKQCVEGKSLRRMQVIWQYQSYSHARRAWSWKTDRAQHGGVLTLLGAHVLFLVEWLVGRVTSIAAVTSDLHTRSFAPAGQVPAEDQIEMRIMAGEGTPVAVWLDNGVEGPGLRLEVEFEDGTRFALTGLRADDAFELSVVRGDDQQMLATDSTLKGVDWRIEPVRRIGERFFTSIRDQSSFSPGLEAGMRVQQLMDLVRESANLGGEEISSLPDSREY